MHLAVIALKFKQISRNRPTVRTDFISQSRYSSCLCSQIPPAACSALTISIVNHKAVLTLYHLCSISLSHFQVIKFKLWQLHLAALTTFLLPTWWTKKSNKLEFCLLAGLSVITQWANGGVVWQIRYTRHFKKLLRKKLWLFLNRWWGIWAGASHFNKSIIMSVVKSLSCSEEKCWRVKWIRWSSDQVRGNIWVIVTQWPCIVWWQIDHIMWLKFSLQQKFKVQTVNYFGKAKIVVRSRFATLFDSVCWNQESHLSKFDVENAVILHKLIIDKSILIIRPFKILSFQTSALTFMWLT